MEFSRRDYWNWDFVLKTSMQYHALSLAKSGFSVTLLGFCSEYPGLREGGCSVSL